MRSEHLVPLLSRDTVFSPDWAFSTLQAAFNHELYGPERFLVRTLTLNTLLYARCQVAADRDYPVTDRRHKEQVPK